LLFLGLALYIPKAFLRGRLPHAGWTMRLARYPQSVTDALSARGPVWIHAVSVGEVIAVQPLLRELRAWRFDVPLVLSTVTPTGFHVASRALGERGAVIYAPYDFSWIVRRALKTIQPRVLILVESELWPNLIRLTKARGIPVVIVNGRISARAQARYLKVRRWLQDIIGCLHPCLMQTEADAQRLVSLGVPADRVRVLGSLKWDASLGSRPSADTLRELRQRLHLSPDQPVLVAGSTHRGEEAAILAAYQALRTRYPTLRLIIAPRHLERVAEVDASAKERGLDAQPVAAILECGSAWDVAIVDTLGQLPTYYALATIAFVGGSLIPHGGQNPLEPASLGKPVVFGPSMDNFTEMVQHLLMHQAARQLESAAELTEALDAILADPAEAATMGARAQALVERLSGASRRTLEVLAPLLEG